MKTLDKIRNLPLATRKIILWTTVIILGFILLFFWIRSFQGRLENFRTERQEFEETTDFPRLEIPRLEISTILEEELTGLEEIIEEMEAMEEVENKDQPIE